MASTLHPKLTIFPSTTNTTNNVRCRITNIRCGPRSNRGPIVRGRILSTEAIHAIQALKRAYRTNPTDLPTHLLSRLIKSDLTAALKELLRQDQCHLALMVFSTIRSEYSVDIEMYSELVLALSRNGLTQEIDELICKMEEDVGILHGGSKGLLRLLNALIGADRKESTVRIFGLMQRGGWGSKYEADEYLGRVLSKGLRKFGEDKLARDVDDVLEGLYKPNGVFVRPKV